MTADLMDKTRAQDSRGRRLCMAEIALLAEVWMPIWAFDSERARMAWANEAALELWDAPSLDESWPATSPT